MTKKWTEVRLEVRAKVLATMEIDRREWRDSAGTAMEEHAGEAIERADCHRRRDTRPA